MYSVITYYNEDLTAMQKLYKESTYVWSEHFIYTRNAIISIIAGLGDIDAVSARLMKNQEDIGAVMAPYYPSATVNELVAALKLHISIAIKLITAAKNRRIK